MLTTTVYERVLSFHRVKGTETFVNGLFNALRSLVVREQRNIVRNEEAIDSLKLFYSISLFSNNEIALRVEETIERVVDHPEMSYNAVATDAENGKIEHKGPVFIHRHTCGSCGAVTEKEIKPENLHQAILTHYPHPPQSAWHAIHSQGIHYTMNVLLVAVVIFLTFIAAKLIFGK